MYSLIVENKYHEKLELTNSNDYAITDISGLNPAPANINISNFATADGSIYNSSFVRQRNIVLTIYILRSIEANRLNLYRYFKPKEKVKIHYKNSSRDVYIEGYVETFEGTFFSQSENFQVSIICPSPYFVAQTESKSILSNVAKKFSFPFSISDEGVAFSELQEIKLTHEIINSGDTQTGMIIDLYASGRVINPTITNVDTGEMFKLNHEMSAGNSIRINTLQGKKSAKLIIYGTERNLINSVAQGSKWLQLDIGYNNFIVSSDSGQSYLTATIHHTNLYEGV